MRRAVSLVAAGLASQLLAAPAYSQQPAILSEAPLGGRPVEFHAVVHPDTVFVGQQANYQVGVFLGDEVRARLRRNPEFVPPEMTGVLGYDLPVAHVLLPDSRGTRYEAHVFERAIFPLAAGTLEIPPARLSYSLPLTRSFFSREESFVLRTESVRMVALPPPAAGRPTDFTGAVGSGLQLRLDLDPAAARVGDPLLVTATITGSGNVNLFPRPRVELSWGKVVDAGERVVLDTTSRVIGGRKEFDWIVTPQRAGDQRVRAMSYSYFDPVAVEYRVAVAPVESVLVRAGAIVALDSAAGTREPLPLRPRYRGATPRPPADSPVYWLAVALLPLPALAVRLRRRRRGPAPVHTSRELLTELVADLDRAGAAGRLDAHAVRRLRAVTLRTIADRLAAKELAATEGPLFVRLLRLEGVSERTAREAARLMADLDRLAFSDPGAIDRATVLAPATAEPDPRDLVARVRSVVQGVDSEARVSGGAGWATVAAAESDRARAHARRGDDGQRRRGLARWVVVVGVAGAAILAAARAGYAGAASASEEPASAAFDHGLALYADGRFAAARDSFAAAARLEPRSADAWANSGTAAWAAGDTSGAAMGWQRALRLQPGAEDVRVRLQALPGGQLSGPAAIPPVAPATLQWSALVIWGGGWLLALWSVTSGGPVLSGTVVALLLLAGVGGGASALLGERAAARGLYVATPGAVLRSQPALAAPGRRALAAGEVVHVRTHSGVWSRVDAAGDIGWVERSRLRELRLE